MSGVVDAGTWGRSQGPNGRKDRGGSSGPRGAEGVAAEMPRFSDSKVSLVPGTLPSQWVNIPDETMVNVM